MNGTLKSQRLQKSLQYKKQVRQKINNRNFRIAEKKKKLEIGQYRQQNRILRVVQNHQKEDKRNDKSQKHGTDRIKHISSSTSRKKMSLGKQEIINLKNKDGIEITNQEKILERIKEFYEDLYKSHTCCHVYQNGKCILLIFTLQVPALV